MESPNKTNKTQKKGGVMRHHVGIAGNNKQRVMIRVGGENGAKTDCEREKKERRVRLLHTVQHARQNTTSFKQAQELQSDTTVTTVTRSLQPSASDGISAQQLHVQYVFTRTALLSSSFD